MSGAISIGAHYGEEYEGWLAQGCTNFIFFEPVYSNYCKLLKILPLSSNVVIHNLAIGNKRGKIEMYVESEHQGKSCSILEPYLHLEQYPDIVFDKKQLVKIDKLDNIDYDRLLFDHLHIDTQGYEMEVLRGAEESLRTIETIQIEVYRKELYKGCAMYEEVWEHLVARGFRQTDIVWRGNTWGDAFFRRIYNAHFNLPL